MRLFIALDFNGLSDYFNAMQHAIPTKDSKLGFTKTFHLTLKFLGEVMPKDVEEVKNKLKNVAFSSFAVYTDSIGLFPDKKNPRVVWLGISPEEPVINLQKDIDLRLKDASKEETEFKPHITLARVKFIGNKEEFHKALSRVKTEQKIQIINNFYLFKSTLAKQGTIHEILEKFPP